MFLLMDKVGQQQMISRFNRMRLTLRGIEQYGDHWGIREFRGLPVLVPLVKMESVVVHCTCAPLPALRSPPFTPLSKARLWESVSRASVARRKWIVYLVSANAPVVQSRVVGPPKCRSCHTFWPRFDTGTSLSAASSMSVDHCHWCEWSGGKLYAMGWDRWRTLPWDAFCGQMDQKWKRTLHFKAKDYGWKLQKTFGPQPRWNSGHGIILKVVDSGLTSVCVRFATRCHHQTAPFTKPQWILWQSSTGHDGAYDGCSQKKEQHSAATGVGPHETLWCSGWVERLEPHM